MQLRSSKTTTGYEPKTAFLDLPTLTIQSTSYDMSATPAASESGPVAVPPTSLETEGGEVTTVEEEKGEEAPPTKPQPKLCGICEEIEGKYKCPRPGCQMP